jgi:hypothetical protein
MYNLRVRQNSDKRVAMQTTFAVWLAERGEATYAFANRFGINQTSVARLAGVSRKAYTPRYFKRDFLTLVSGETGIPIETLIDDATKAAANPTPPRRYTRRENTDGKGTHAAE